MDRAKASGGLPFDLVGHGNDGSLLDRRSLLVQLREEVAAAVRAEYTALGEVAQTLGLTRPAR